MVDQRNKLIGQSSSVQKEKLRHLEGQKILKQTYIRALVHCYKCNDADCQFPGCIKMTKATQHMKMCKKKKKKKRNCRSCQQLFSLCRFHIKNCSKQNCSVPFCLKIKYKLEKQKLRYRIKQDQLFRKGLLTVMKTRKSPRSVPMPQASEVEVVPVLQPTGAVPVPQASEVVAVCQPSGTVPVPQASQAVPILKLREAFPVPQASQAVPILQLMGAFPVPQASEVVSVPQPTGSGIEVLQTGCSNQPNSISKVNTVEQNSGFGVISGGFQYPVDESKNIDKVFDTLTSLTKSQGHVHIFPIIGKIPPKSTTSPPSAKKTMKTAILDQLVRVFKSLKTLVQVHSISKELASDPELMAALKKYNQLGQSLGELRYFQTIPINHQKITNRRILTELQQIKLLMLLWKTFTMINKRTEPSSSASSQNIGSSSSGQSKPPPLQLQQQTPDSELEDVKVKEQLDMDDDEFGSEPEQPTSTVDHVKRRLTQRQQLLILLHASYCQNQNIRYNQQQCLFPHCKTMKVVLNHMKTCQNGEDCTVPLCFSTQEVMSHWKDCSSPPDCTVCFPVKQAGLDFPKDVPDVSPSQDIKINKLRSELEQYSNRIRLLAVEPVSSNKFTWAQLMMKSPAEQALTSSSTRGTQNAMAPVQSVNQETIGCGSVNLNNAMPPVQPVNQGITNFWNIVQKAPSVQSYSGFKTEKKLILNLRRGNQDNTSEQNLMPPVQLINQSIETEQNGVLQVQPGNQDNTSKQNVVPPVQLINQSIATGQNVVLQVHPGNQDKIDDQNVMPPIQPTNQCNTSGQSVMPPVQLPNQQGLDSKPATQSEEVNVGDGEAKLILKLRWADPKPAQRNPNKDPEIRK